MSAHKTGRDKALENAKSKRQEFIDAEHLTALKFVDMRVAIRDARMMGATPLQIGRALNMSTQKVERLLEVQHDVIKDMSDSV